MRSPTLLRRGDRGEAVRDLQERLAGAGFPVCVDGTFGDLTDAAVRAFQRARAIRVDGVCGPETWGALVESGYRLGDRLLYLRSPMLRGDDVVDLQQRLNRLGFDAGREDGILGTETESAIRQFQRDSGRAPDGVCGPATLEALLRVGTLAAGSVAAVREREALRRREASLAQRRVFVVGDPALALLASATARGLRARGAVVALDVSGDDPSVLAAQANRFGADVCIAFVVGADRGARCAYFENQRFRSEAGFCVAQRTTEALASILGDVEQPVGRTYRLLRETRMAAVVCELFSADDGAVASALARRLPELAAAIVEGIRRGVEEPVTPT